MYALETMLNTAADELGLDHFEIRQKNALRSGDVTGNGMKITTCGLSDCLNKVKEAMDWENKKGKLPPYRGIAVAASGMVTGTNIMGHSACAAMLKVNEDGSVALLSGATDVGQGCDTVLPMIVAEVLGISVEEVSFALVDTNHTPVDPGTWSSRVTFYAGNAVKNAAWDARNQIAQLVAERLGAKPEDRVFHKRRVYDKGNPDGGRDLDWCIRYCQNRLGVPIMGRGSYNAPCDTVDFSKGIGNLSSTYSYYVQACEVEVDPETGKVDILKVGTAHDGGQELNPMLVRGQLIGSFIMHQGQTMFEGIIRDDKGRTLNPSFLEYKMVTAADIPRRFELYPAGVIDPEGPFGAKEAGEGSGNPCIAALANAIYDAIGVRIKGLPLTPEKIVMALKEKNKTA